MPGQLPQILSPRSIRLSTEPQQVKQERKHSRLLKLSTLLLLSHHSHKNSCFWEALWVLQNLLYILCFICIWFLVSEPAHRCFTSSFSVPCWPVFVVCCFHTGYHLESFCSLWYDHSTNLPWNCPVRFIPVYITTLQQSLWHIWYVLSFGTGPSRFVRVEALAVNVAIDSLNGNVTRCHWAGWSHCFWDLSMWASRAGLMQTPR